MIDNYGLIVLMKEQAEERCLCLYLYRDTLCEIWNVTELTLNTQTIINVNREQIKSYLVAKRLFLIFDSNFLKHFFL